MRWFSRLVVCVALTTSATLAGDPDFSGMWTLIESRSERPRSGVTPWNVMKVFHQDAEMRCFPDGSDSHTTKSPEILGLKLHTDGKETIQKIAASTTKTVAKWEGSALLINTIVSGAQRGYTQMDRWKLSRDGAVLTIRRQIVTIHGETESTLVYERQ